LANLNARKRSNTPMVHGSGIDQAVPATKLSTLAFAPANRPTAERNGISDSIVTSLPIRSVVQMNGQNGSIVHADVAEVFDQGIEEKLDTPVDGNQSTLQVSNA